MKLFFKIILLLSLITSSYSKQIILITYNKDLKRTAMVEKLLLSKFNMPKKIIAKHWKKNPCRVIDETILHICIQNNGEINFPKIQTQEILNALSIFYKETKL